MKTNPCCVLFLIASFTFLVGCNSNSDATVSEVEKENLPPRIDRLSYEQRFSFRDDKALMLSVVGTVAASDLDGNISEYKWSLISGQGVELKGVDTQSVSFELPLISSEDPNQIIIETTVIDDDGAMFSTQGFDKDINNYSYAFLWDTEVRAGEIANISADVRGRESITSALEWSVKSEHEIILLDANTKTVSFLVPELSENNQIILQLKRTLEDGSVVFASNAESFDHEVNITILP